MWCPGKDQLQATSAGAAFAALRWHELFGQHTPDIHHPKLFNLPGLLEEALFVGKLLPAHERWGKHLHGIREEIASRFSDLEFSISSPRTQHSLQKVGSVQTSHQEALALCRMLQMDGFGPTTEGKLVERLDQVDWPSVGKRKSDADQLLTALGTFAYRKGIAFVDDETLQQVLGQGDGAVHDWLKSQHPTTVQAFECIVGIEARTEAEVTRIRRICDHNTGPVNQKIFRASPGISGLPQEPGIGWFRASETALHAAAAIEQFKNRVRTSLNLMALYDQRPAPTVLDGGWILQDDRALSIRPLKTALQNLHGRRKATSLSDFGAKVLAGIKEPAIHAALDLHNAALSMEDHRFRLVNLWSALECAASMLEGQNIIMRISAFMPPMLAWRNIDKMTRYLAISLYFWLESNPEIDATALPFKRGSTGRIPPEKLLTSLASPKGAPNIKSLLAVAADHPLLLYRLNSAWSRFHDPVELRNGLLKSRKRLAWHLYRIYRARNLLIHEGMAGDCLPQLADHLQHYVSWILSRLVQALGMEGGLSMRDAWQYWKSKADYVVDGLPQSRNEDSHLSLTVGDVFSEKLWEPEYPIWMRQGVAP